MPANLRLFFETAKLFPTFFYLQPQIATSAAGHTRCPDPEPAGRNAGRSQLPRSGEAATRPPPRYRRRSRVCVCCARVARVYVSVFPHTHQGARRRFIYLFIIIMVCCFLCRSLCRPLCCWLCRYHVGNALWLGISLCRWPCRLPCRQPCS